MVEFDLPPESDALRSVDGRARLCAVSYLNTLPLVWGMLHGEQRGRFQLQFRLPSECAELLAARRVDAGLVPVAEIPRLGLKAIAESGIACEGAVRSILLVSKCRPSRIRSLAADSSSRTSVMLARIVLSKAYGIRPLVFSTAPDLSTMLSRADAALIIGDPALRLNTQELPYDVLDLGLEWKRLTGLPMVFALWAGHDEVLNEAIAPALHASQEFGLERMPEIAFQSAAAHGVSVETALEYLSRHIVFRIGDRERDGLKLFEEYAAEVGAADNRTKVTA